MSLDEIKIYQRFLPSYGIRLMKRYLNGFESPIKILDIGCGNHSVSKFRLLYGSKIYYVGVDKEKYNISENDLRLMDEFHLVDLENNGLAKLDGQKFDVIYFSHVIEHIDNGYDIIRNFRSLQNRGGLVYIETPSENSKNFPKKKLSILNFYDDPTHKQVYPLHNITASLKEGGYEIIRYGVRRDFRRILISPVAVIAYVAQGKEIPGQATWDIRGFANFALSRAL